MLDRFDRPRGYRASAILVAGAVAAVGSPAVPAYSEVSEGTGGAEAPALSLTVTDERDEAEPGDGIEYTVILRNRGTAEVADLLVSQRLPDEAELLDAGADAAVAGDGVTWTVTIAPGGKVERRTRIRLAEAPEDTRYVTTTVCARTARGAPPVACVTDADRLRRPAEEVGSAAEAAAPSAPESPTATAAAVAGTSGSEPTVPPAAVSAAGLGLLFAGAAMLALDTRRRRRAAVGREP